MIFCGVGREGLFEAFGVPEVGALTVGGLGTPCSGERLGVVVGAGASDGGGVEVCTAAAKYTP